MGRYYTGDIEGKFWFGLQSSTAADRFGVSYNEPNYVEYYYDQENLEGVETEIKSIEDALGDKIKIIDDFSYLMLMTDGIYDAKFVVEANLEKLEKWKEFIEDLQGNNEDNAKVVFEESNTEIANQLSTWMDFWSPGNHDDRTLAIVF